MLFTCPVRFHWEKKTIFLCTFDASCWDMGACVPHLAFRPQLAWTCVCPVHADTVCRTDMCDRLVVFGTYCLYDVIYPLLLLYSFFLYFHRIPYVLRGRILWRHLTLEWVLQNLSFYILASSGSLFLVPCTARGRLSNDGWDTDLGL